MNTTSTFREERAVGSFLAAAVGDALGWPFEGRARKSQSNANAGSTRQPAELEKWTRSGSRSQPYREPIGAGDYSDDTQLLLSTARSILVGQGWWEHYAFVELPFWLSYERGGGGATKRAAQAWLVGKAPWESKQHRAKYFEAGGNGVAMRILPHLLESGSSKDACGIAGEIIANGLCTHGHPRALVGALLHGMALWLSLQQEEMLEFGALTRAVYQGFPEWAQLRDVPTQWQGAFSDSEFRDYRALWDKTVGESMALIEMAEDALRLGPLSAGPETLHKLGALNPRTNGSGTITAAAALFLASRYAATPLQGVQVAATSTGADTDTMASMCGSILGAIHGDEWLGHFASSVQDSRYIRKIAGSLVSTRGGSASRTEVRVTKRACDSFEDQLGTIEVGADLRLPDGRQAVLRHIEPMFSETAQADLLSFETDDGQTLPVKRIVRRRRAAQTSPHQRPDEILRVGIKVFVSDLVVAKEFYIGKLRLPVMKEYSSGFTVAEVISVHLASSEAQGNLSFHQTPLPAPTPYIRVANVDSVSARLAAEGIIITPVSGHRSIKAFTVSDPFGNVLEFFEAR
jgi:ADP-ribosylglycohydrolase